MFILLSAVANAQNQFEGKKIVDPVDVTFEGNDRDLSAAEQFRLIARGALGEAFSAVRVREAIQRIYDTGRVASVSVEAEPIGEASVRLRFVIKRKTRAERLVVKIGKFTGEPITEDELLFKLNLLTPGQAVTEQVLQSNANAILEYLRDRGYYNSEVTYSQTPLTGETQVAVRFDVSPNVQARVSEFKIAVTGFDAKNVLTKLNLKTGAPFSKAKLNEDVQRVESALREQEHFAPDLIEPRVVFDPDNNSVAVSLSGKVGAVVRVEIESDKEKVGNGTRTKLLPILREGTLDYSAIVEGERRLENYFQEQGFFFADVTPVCSVTPAFTETEASYIVNGTETLCSALAGAELDAKTVDVKYLADLNRQFKLVDIRIEGTKLLPAAEVKTVLESQQATVLGIVPYLGYGRGYTSSELLSEDRETIQSLMRELGFRSSTVTVKQGVSPNGEDLIITFVVNEGRPTRIDEVQLIGNSAFSESVLKSKLPNLIGQNYSRARIRNGVKKLVEFYSNEGFYEAGIIFEVEEKSSDETEDRIKVIYRVENEGKRVIINRIRISGNERTARNAILKALNLRVGNVLRAADIFASEQNLYASDAFKRVEIKTEPAGEGTDGNRLIDIVINVEEQPPRLITYGGGFSTDAGPFGSFDIRHFNLFGKLQQGGARARISRLQQIFQVDYVNPRFISDGRSADGVRRFSPLTFTAQYQRDSTVTRFFRSAFDKGTFGVVQRIDANGNPIDQFGNNTGDPTINRLTLFAETSRTINYKERSLIFLRYRFEDVRLFNIESLLIKDLLLPDAKIRISGFGATYVRDTRENCNFRYSVLEIISKGEAGDPCRYNPGDPTKGEYITAEYNLSLPFLGANIGFQKFQASYYRFYTVPALKNTTFAGRAVIGLANVFSKRSRFNSTQFPDLDGILPISERFFAGGSTSIRGFDFESAGPRVVIAPQGTFRDQSGQIIALNPFTVPFGGNALAIVNLEARIPLTKSIRAVPFYDGGNVFRRIGDIFNPPDVPAGDTFRQNLRALWSHTVGLGLRLKTPVGGEFGVDFGYLLNPPQFRIPQPIGPDGIYRLRQEQIHFRFSQAF
ncbi:MAG: BamA/TamA family outer membrane protein [Acidobacteria bacterium]|nr:BamA/TamA family outer membrane protein [Acidobacteriota bacterium]MBK8148673.1 BamA/TamA family outer membrane protein [Acidobacteriota bacterium]MBK8810280.1 BamA/TamA family outer membrane protein [Acidobacteriota bacterium]